MRQILAIFRREQRAFFTSTMVPVITTGFLVLTGLFWYLFVLGYAETSMTAAKSGRPSSSTCTPAIFHRLYGMVVIFLIFLMPAITMRLLSSEYGSGRYDLLASWPVPERHWILGKWLSALAVAAVLLLGAAFYFGLTWVLGGMAERVVRPDWQPLVTSLLGLVLLAGGRDRLGRGGLGGCSSTRRPPTSWVRRGHGAVPGGALEPLLPGVRGRAAGMLALRSDHFRHFAGGRDRPARRGLLPGPVGRGSGGGRGGADPAPTAPPGAAGPGCRCWWSCRWRSSCRQWRCADRCAWTSRRPASTAWRRRPSRSCEASTVRAPVPRAGRCRRQASRCWRSTTPSTARARASRHCCGPSPTLPQLTFDIVDPNAEPDLVREHGVTQARTVVVISGKRRRLLLEPDEGQLAGAIYRLATDTRPIVYWLQGHGEARPIWRRAAAPPSWPASSPTPATTCGP